MKKIFFAILFSILSCSLFAQFMESHFFPVSNGEENMNIIYKIPDFFEEFTLPEENQQEISPDRSFRVKFDGIDGEVHFVLFADTGVDKNNSMREVDSWNTLILQNLAGYGVFRNMKYSDKIAKIFKGQIHGACMVQPKSSSFARDYKYAFVDSTYKQGVGICMRIFLMNDQKFAAREMRKQDKSKKEDSKKDILKKDFYKYFKSFSF